MRSVRSGKRSVTLNWRGTNVSARAIAARLVGGKYLVLKLFRFYQALHYTKGERSKHWLGDMPSMEQAKALCEADHQRRATRKLIGQMKK
jgi:hypothetical protein